MKAHPLIGVVFGFSILVSPALAAAAKGVSDLASPAKRQATVELAEKLTRPPVPAPVPDDLVSPFNPPNFSQPDPEEAKANAAAGVRAAANAAGAQAPAGPATDRELLANIAAGIQPTGSFVLPGGVRQLTFPNAKRVSAGQTIVVTYPIVNGQDYELELVAINPPNFTLRLRGEEITRPIKSTK